MHVLIQHDNGVITQVTFAHVVAQQRTAVPVRLDEAKAAALPAGATMTQADYEKAVMVWEKRLLALSATGQLLNLPADTVVLNATKLKDSLLIDFARHWRTGKYTLVEEAITLAAAWEEPTVVVSAPGGNDRMTE